MRHRGRRAADGPRAPIGSHRRLDTVIRVSDGVVCGVAGENETVLLPGDEAVIPAGESYCRWNAGTRRGATPRCSVRRAPPRPCELARAHLVYGEWLRRENRRVDAREELRTAYELFVAIGMEAFAERARHELHATGGTVRKRTLETRDDLTARERQSH